MEEQEHERGKGAGDVDVDPDTIDNDVNVCAMEGNLQFLLEEPFQLSFFTGWIFKAGLFEKAASQLDSI